MDDNDKDAKKDKEKKEEMPEWAKTLKEKVEQLAAKISEDQSQETVVEVPVPPATQPPTPEEPPTSEEPEKPDEPEPNPKRKLLDWLL